MNTNKTKNATATTGEYTAEAIWHGDELQDIVLDLGGRSLPMYGNAGARRELSALPSWAKKFNDEGSPKDSQPEGSQAEDKQDANKLFNPKLHLPVFIGAGAGAALAEFIKQWLEFQSEQGNEADISKLRLAVVDKEEQLRKLARLEEHPLLKQAPICWISNDSPNEALRLLTEWQLSHGGLPMYPIVLPFYLRLNRDYYGHVQESVKASLKANFWHKALYPKFKNSSPRILLLISKYFLIGEILAACERLNVEHRLVQFEEHDTNGDEFVQRLLREVLEFQPDFIFTINHLGVDREGLLVDLLKRLSIPLCSWFVDNPHLILNAFPQAASPDTVILTWDADNIDSLKELGFEQVIYMPLGSDVKRFTPPTAPLPIEHYCRARVSFVGNSMVEKVSKSIRGSGLRGDLVRNYRQVAADFAMHDERSVNKFIQHYHSDIYNGIMSRPNGAVELQTYETFITWEATRQYRMSCVEAILPFNPLIVGDKGWKVLFSKSKYPWRYHPELAYYDALPNFYPLSEINFNCTSKQMKGAVNQRVFDVPATGSFIITDWREQIEQLFVPGSEVVCYHEPAEGTELVRYYLAHPAERNKIAQAARKRVLAEHTYDHRLKKILQIMKEFAG